VILTTVLRYHLRLFARDAQNAGRKLRLSLSSVVISTTNFPNCRYSTRISFLKFTGYRMSSSEIVREMNSTPHRSLRCDLPDGYRLWNTYNCFGLWRYYMLIINEIIQSLISGEAVCKYWELLHAENHALPWTTTFEKIFYFLFVQYKRNLFSPYDSAYILLSCLLSPGVSSRGWRPVSSVDQIPFYRIDFLEKLYRVPYYRK